MPGPWPRGSLPGRCPRSSPRSIPRGSMLSRTERGELTLYFDGTPLPAREGDSVAAALLASGVLATRRTAASGAPRGPYCMMGVCFDCLAVVDGQGGVQLCLTQARDGMRIETQRGARGLDEAA